jgi:hypothetical protein
MPVDLNAAYRGAYARDAAAYLQAMQDLAVVVGGPHDAYGRGTMPAGWSAPMRETLREYRVRLWKRPMFTLKDDDPRVTWDHKAMAARPFRARKD